MRHSSKVSGLGIARLPGQESHLCKADALGSCLAEETNAIVLSFDLENDPALIPGVLAQLLAVAERLRLFDEKTVHRVGLALHEALLNGIHHGNLELDSALRQGDERTYHRLAEYRRRMPRYRGRRLHVAARFDPSGAVFVIRDDGRGFNPNRLPDPTDPEILDRPCGRGLLLIRAFMDEVAFNASGNEITLVKRRTDPIPGAVR